MQYGPMKSAYAFLSNRRPGLRQEDNNMDCKGYNVRMRTELNW
jgi:hypothetical protein